MRFVVSIQVVLQLVHQAREFLQPVVDHNAGMLRYRTYYCVMNRLSSLFDELDVQLHALVWLIGNGAHLLLLVRRERIVGALCVQRCG